MAETTPPTVTPLEGKTIVDRTLSFGPERLSYASAVDVADRIAKEIREAVRGQTVVIAGAPFLADLANLETTRIALEELATTYDALASHADEMTGPGKAAPQVELKTIAGQKVAPLGGPVISAASSALGLVSLFREDVEYVAAKTVVNPLAFELAVAAKLKTGGASRVVVPDLMIIQRDGAREGSLRSLIHRVERAKAKAWTSLAPLVKRLVQLEASLDKATAAKDQKLVDRLSEEVTNLRRDMDPVVTPLGRADRALADLQAQWSKPPGDDAGGVVLLSRLLRAEAIATFGPLYLHAAVVSSGGHHRTSRNLLRMIFLGDGLTFAGGAIVRWALLDANGSVSEHGGISSEMRSSSMLDAIADASRPG